MSISFQGLVADAAAQGAITASDILALRQTVWTDNSISAEEAEAILAINTGITDPDAGWTDFFVEALTQWLVHAQDPRGYVDEAQGGWLLDRIDRGGRVETMAEIELLVHLLEAATSTPQSLRAYALAQVEKAVMDGNGPTRAGGTLEPGKVTAGEAQLLRRMIFASGGDGPASVSVEEAELLFRIKNASLGADNAPEWKQLFVQGVGNYLEGCRNLAPLSRAREAELETFVESRDEGVGGFLSRMFRSSPDMQGAKVYLQGGEMAPERLGSTLAAMADTDAAITSGEQAWIDARIQADGTIDPYEQALLDFLREDRLAIGMGRW